MKLDAKQKILLPVIVMVFIFIGWQVYNMLGTNSDNSLTSVTSDAGQQVNMPMPVSAVPRTSPSPSANMSIEKNVNSGGMVNPNPTATNIAASGESNQGGSSPMMEPEKPQRATIKNSEESADLGDSLMQEYQELKKEEMLLNEKLAIAQARQKIAELNSKIAALGGGNSSVSSITTSVIGKNNIAYRLVYVDYQGDKWAATLSDSTGGNLQEVVAGSKLPDGTKVIAVNAKGVTVKKNDKKTLLTFSGAVALGAAEVEKVEKDEQGATDEVTAVPKKAKVSKKASVKTSIKKVAPKNTNRSSKPETNTNKQANGEPEAVKQIVSSLPASPSGSSVGKEEKKNIPLELASTNQPVTQLVATEPSNVSQITAPTNQKPVKSTVTKKQTVSKAKKQNSDAVKPKQTLTAVQQLTPNPEMQQSSPVKTEMTAPVAVEPAEKSSVIAPKVYISKEVKPKTVVINKTQSLPKEQSIELSPKKETPTNSSEELAVVLSPENFN